MRNAIVRTMAEMEISETIRNEFIDDLRNQIAGMYIADDIRSTEAILEDADRHFPEQWKPETKRELVTFLVCRAELYIEEENKKKARPPRGGWHNSASAENGKKGGRPKKKTDKPEEA